MKKFLLLTFVLAFIGGSVAYNLNLSLGIKYWPSTWDITAFPILIFEHGGYGEYQFEDHWENAKALETSSTGLVGISGNINFSKRIAMGFTYLYGSFDFKIKQEFQVTSGPAVSITNYNFSFPVKRQDFDLALVYKLSGKFGIFAGYKLLTYSYGEQEYSYEQYQIYPEGTETTKTYVDTLPAYKAVFQGVGLGATYFQPIGSKGFYVFGALSFMPYFTITTAGTYRHFSDDVGYAYNGEAGLGYKIPNLPLSIRLSIRHQRFDGFVTKELNTNEAHIFTGAILNISFHF